MPYTFLNTIFINQDDYHNRQIEARLYTHELIHGKTFNRHIIMKL
jgi:hypothetical protein